MTPLVSIIIPVYNHAPYIKNTLDSVIKQTYTSWECILVNDGSTDESETIILNTIGADPRFKYIGKHNEGVSIARNTAMQKASGKYILPLDGDDSLNPKYVELGIDAFEKNATIGLVYGNANLVGIKNGIWDLPAFEWETFLLSNCIHCSALFLKSDFDLTNGYDPSLKHGLEDWAFWISLLSKTKKGVHKLDYVGLNYLIKESSRNQDIRNHELNMNESLAYIYSKHQELYTTTFGNYISLASKAHSLETENKRLTALLKKQPFQFLLWILNKLRK